MTMRATNFSPCSLVASKYFTTSRSLFFKALRTMRVIQTCGNEVYCLTDSRIVPAYLRPLIAPSAGENRQKGKSETKKIEDEDPQSVNLIQDFFFPGCSGKIRVSADKRFIAASGIYPPQVNVYETDEMSLKFNRKVDSDIVDFLILSDDYKKLVFLEENRDLEFHTQGGRHHIIRVPNPGRCLAFNANSAELWISTSSPFLYCLDLCEGRYRLPIKTEKDFVERIKVINGLIFAVGEGGTVDIWDPRHSNSQPSLSLKTFAFDDGLMSTGMFNKDASMTAVDVHNNELLCAVGSSEGVCRLFDVRVSEPLMEKDHSFESRIVDIHFCNLPSDEGATTGFISADERFIRISRLTQNNSSVASFEAGAKINCVEQFPDSGLLLTALDQPRMGIHLVPSLGIAPSWTPFLDELVLDAHENKDSSVFRRYEFITRADVERFGKINEKISEMLKPHQHGFLILKTDLKMLQRQYRIVSGNELQKEKLIDQLKRFKDNAPMRPRIDGIIKSSGDASVPKTLPLDKNERKRKYLERKRERMTDEILGDDRFGNLFDTNYLDSIEKI